MEPDHYARYSQLVAQCGDIATKIHPHCREGGVNEMTALDQDLSDAPLTVKILSRAKALNTSKTTAEDFILSDRQSQASSFILRCWDGPGATLYDRSVASAILLSANPSSTVIISDATCTAPSSRISK